MTLRNKALMKNIEQVGYHDLQKRPAFQIVMQKCGEKYYLYCASWRHNGWSILDVTDPTNPKMIQLKKDHGSMRIATTDRIHAKFRWRTV